MEEVTVSTATPGAESDGTGSGADQVRHTLGEQQLYRQPLLYHRDPSLNTQLLVQQPRPGGPLQGDPARAETARLHQMQNDLTSAKRATTATCSISSAAAWAAHLDSRVFSARTGRSSSSLCRVPASQPDDSDQEPLQSRHPKTGIFRTPWRTVGRSTCSIWRRPTGRLPPSIRPFRRSGDGAARRRRRAHSRS